ncbi:hypothetical protein PIB30_063620 [Stylosanthes scabra]|uniref:Uncharacterized protein n=1 Tax=Stylosanthes scabra TaxID=79078 RepID=A0ABU6YIZ9_9FABA|nr:hypothetical protein [Stylosanthes scabra]
MFRGDKDNVFHKTHDQAVELYLQRYHDLISKKEILNRSWGAHQIFGTVARDEFRMNGVDFGRRKRGSSGGLDNGRGKDGGVWLVVRSALEEDEGVFCLGSFSLGLMINTKD